MEAPTMTRPNAKQAGAKKTVEEGVRGLQKATTFTPADARRLELYGEREDRSVAWLIHRAVIAELDAQGIVDDGFRATDQAQ